MKFPVLAEQVELAYQATEEGDESDVPNHQAWLKQAAGLKQWVERGVDGIYAIYHLIPEEESREKYIWVWRDNTGRLILRQGSHRCLALWILGEREAWAVVTDPDG